MCDTTRWEKVKREWVLNECGLNIKMISLSERSGLKWFDHREKMNENQVAKQIFEG